MTTGSACLGCQETRRDQRRFCRHIVFYHGMDLPNAEAKDLLDALDHANAAIESMRPDGKNGGEAVWG